MVSGLEGIKVVEAASAVGAPMAGRLLADWGADVIHIERIARSATAQGQPAGQSSERQIAAGFNYNNQNIGCNKKCVALDLSLEGGREVMYKLLLKADIFLSNFRSRELEKFKLEYDTLSKLNPKLICATLTGFGRKGPDRDEPGFGRTAGDARSGFLHVLQVSGGEPPETPIAYADFITGLTLAYGLMTALFIRERTGVAQAVDASLFNSVVWALTTDVAGSLVTGKDRQTIKRKDRGTPLMNTYQTKDGRWLYLMMTRRDVYWSRFCQTMERQDLQHDSRFTSPEMTEEDNLALFNILNEAFLTRTLDEWKPRLTAVGFPWAPLQTLPEVVNDPQARANDFFVPLDHPKYGRIEIVGNPAKLSKTPETVKKPAPEFNEHTEEVLLELGYTQDDITKLKEEGAII